MPTTTELAAGPAEGPVAATARVSDTLDRIDRLDGHLNAFVATFASAALARAAELDAMPIEARGPLHGTPVAVKELFDVRGVRTTGCCAAYESHVPDADAEVVTRLVEAGAIVVGKTNQHQLAVGATNALSSAGPVRNPWEPLHLAGGSSGGAAAAVAAGLVPVAVGSDAAGSVRIPGAFCGVTSLKPTLGAISLAGAMPGSPSVNTVGLIARAAADLVVPFDVLAVFDPADPVSAQRPQTSPHRSAGFRIGVPSAYLVGAHPEVRAALESAGDQLAQLGSTVLATADDLRDDGWSTFASARADFLVSYDGRLDESRLHDELAAILEAGRSMTGQQYAESAAAARRLRQRFRCALIRVDMLLLPVTAAPAPPLDSDPIGRHLADLTMPVSVAGLPSVGFPVGISSGGLPIGVQLVGRPWSEPDLLGAVAEYQRVTSWHRQQPPRRSAGGRGDL